MYFNWCTTLFSIIFIVNLFLPCDNVITIDATQTEKTLLRFWDSTGFSPPGPGEEAFKYLTATDVKRNIVLIGSLPFDAIRYVRIHWLLDLIHIMKDCDFQQRRFCEVTCFNSSEQSTMCIYYDYRYLNDLLDTIIEFNLVPGFELMGNPGNLFNDLNDNETTVTVWKDLITRTAKRYIDRYGVEKVNHWRFETWNEPDLHMYNILNFTYPGYLRYYNACRTALDQACNDYNLNEHKDKSKEYCSIKLGGPAGVFKAKKKHKLCWGLLNHCAIQYNPNNGIQHSITNDTKFAVSDGQECRLDFVSFHKKGSGSPRRVVKSTKQLYYNIKVLYGNDSRLPAITNNEADLLTGWWRNESWRGDVRYAAGVCQVLIMLYEQLYKNISGKFSLSNDNAFLNYNENSFYFSQRTLLTRFLMHENKVNDNVTDETAVESHIQFFQKPVYVAVGMLAYLYEISVPVVYSPRNDRLRVIATTTKNVTVRNDWCLSLIAVYSSPDDVNITENACHTATIHIYIPPSVTYGKYVVYTLNNNLTHPVSIWIEAGRPDQPDSVLRKHMRQAQGPHRIQFGDISYNSSIEHNIIAFNLKFSLPSVTLIHICQYSNDSSAVPGQVADLKSYNVTYNEVLLVWSDAKLHTKCIKTYEVDFCYSDSNFGNCSEYSFHRINEFDLIFPSFQYAPANNSNKVWHHREGTENEINNSEEIVLGLYRVRAVDYWNRTGPYSKLLHYYKY